MIVEMWEFRDMRRTLPCTHVCALKRPEVQNTLTLVKTAPRDTDCSACPAAQQPLGGSLDHQFLFSARATKGLVTVKRRYKCAQYYQGFTYTSIMYNHPKTPSQVWYIACGRHSSIYWTTWICSGPVCCPFQGGKERTQCVSSGCPLLRWPFIPVTKMGLEIRMGRVSNRHVIAVVTWPLTLAG